MAEKDLGDDLLTVVKQVLTGKITREELAKRPEGVSKRAHRERLMCVGIALMLATRYMLDSSNRTQGALSNILCDLTYTGTQAEAEWREGSGEWISSADLQQAAARLGLHEPGVRGGHRLLTLTPPLPLQELVQELKHHPAVQEYMSGVDGYAEWQLSLQDDVSRAINTISNRYGRRGLEELLHQARADLEE